MTKARTVAMMVVMTAYAITAQARERTATAAPQVNINTASAQQLQLLPGVGPKIAQAIVDARPYARVDDLVRAKGIGDKKMTSLRPYVTVSGPTTATVKIKVPKTRTVMTSTGARTN